MEEDKNNNLGEPLLGIHRKLTDENALTDQRAFKLTGGFGIFQLVLCASLMISF